MGIISGSFIVDFGILSNVVGTNDCVSQRCI